MRNNTRTKTIVALTLGLFLAPVVPAPAMAAPGDTAPAPAVTSQESQATLDGLNKKTYVSVPGATRGAAAGGMGTNGFSISAEGHRRASGKVGTFLLWHEINVDFYYNWSRVTSSYAWQNGGRAGLNTLVMTGVRKSYDNGWTRNYHSSATAGIGVPTPWGGVNVVESPSNLWARVHGDGAWGVWN